METADQAYERLMTEICAICDDDSKGGPYSKEEKSMKEGKIKMFVHRTVHRWGHDLETLIEAAIDAIAVIHLYNLKGSEYRVRNIRFSVGRFAEYFQEYYALAEY